jgi:hypothetical protein
MTWATFSHLGEQVADMIQGKEMETLYVPPFNLSVLSSGEVEVTLPVDGGNMPNCEDFNMAGCDWDSKLRRKVTGDDTVIDTTLTKDGEVIGQAQVMEVNTAEYEELKILHDMGYEKAWISHVRVARAFRGNGLGRTMWQASDTMIKVLVGSGNAVHIFVDQAGWGSSIMRNINPTNIVAKYDNWFAYIIE